MPSKKESLSVTHPELAAQADGWDPTTVTKGSNKRVSWKCEYDHVWTARPNDRSNGNGCPICLNKTVLAGYNDLATTNPELAAQADGWDPRTLTAHSGKKVGWRCAQDHTWTSNLDNRSKGNGCPICSGNQILAGYNDLATTNPELAAQADGWDPRTVSSFSHRKVDWLCAQNHSWSATVADRSSGKGCPICSGNQVLAGYNDLATTNPELAEQAHGWDPRTLTAGSSKKVGWRCEKGHIWQAGLYSRSGGNQCPICANQLVQVGYNDLATTNPELAAQADGWDPTTLTAHSNKKVGWRCEKGHTWQTRPNTRSNGIGCPICSNTQVLAGYNDLATTNPELAEQAHGWDPTTVTRGSGQKVSWTCEKGHAWIAAVSTRSKGDNCPICSGHQVLAGYNDLATTNPELAEQAHGWDPTTLTAGSGKKVGWRCAQNHTWQTTPSTRSIGRGCPICSNKKVLSGYNDLVTTNPELAAEADGWDPTTLTAHSNKKVGWRCEKGHTWQTKVSHRSNGIGCPSCAVTGFDPNRDGWLYFIDHDALHMFQIGISNVPVARLGQHSKRGWEVIEVRGPMEGHLAQQLETAILHAVERRGAVLGHKAEIEKFDGYSEAWTKDSLSVTSFKQLLDWVYEDDKNSLTKNRIFT
jgi:plastocyanin